jgi:uncharacterized RDD family membrane protein YckC
VVVGSAVLLSLALNYEGNFREFLAVCDPYAKANGVDLTKLTEAEPVNYSAFVEALSSDATAVKMYTLLLNYSFIILSFSILIGYLLMEFLIPLLFKNGQTLGKKIFGIAVMREDGVRISSTLLFVRTVLGKYTLETMIPVLIFLMILFYAMNPIIGLGVVAAILIAQAVLLIATKTRSLLHDKLSHTVTVDFSSQLIFDTPEELLAYKQRIHAEQVEAERE